MTIPIANRGPWSKNLGQRVVVQLTGPLPDNGTAGFPRTADDRVWLTRTATLISKHSFANFRGIPACPLTAYCHGARCCTPFVRLAAWPKTSGMGVPDLAYMRR